MSSLLLGAIVLGCLFASALAGIWLRHQLPSHHLSMDSKDAIRISTAIVGTLAALALGLLIASAKDSYDDAQAELNTSAGHIVLLDRVMAQYGTETIVVRAELRRLLGERLSHSWVDEQTVGATDPSLAGDAGVESVQDMLRGLTPANDGQRWLQNRALAVSGDIAEAHWLRIEAESEGLPGPFIVVLVFWLALLFVSFGLQAPGNTTVLATLFVCALSVAGAVFLLVDMDQPYLGLIRISDAPLREAFLQLGRN